MSYRLFTINPIHYTIYDVKKQAEKRFLQNYRKKFQQKSVICAKALDEKGFFDYNNIFSM